MQQNASKTSAVSFSALTRPREDTENRKTLLDGVSEESCGIALVHLGSALVLSVQCWVAVLFSALLVDAGKDEHLGNDEDEGHDEESGICGVSIWL